MFFRRPVRFAGFQRTRRTAAAGEDAQDRGEKKTAEEEQKLLETIPLVFPQIAPAENAFVLVQRYGGLRLVDVVTLLTDSLREDALMILSQEKNEQPVFTPLPTFVIELLRKLSPKSAQYFFWTGTSTVKTAVNDWSEKMRQLYVEAGIEGKRTHEWRDTLATEVLEGGGTLEDVQLLLWPQISQDHGEVLRSSDEKTDGESNRGAPPHWGCGYCGYSAVPGSHYF